MTDEEKKEINKLKEKYQTEFLDDYEIRFIFNVVKKQQEEIEKNKKIIDLMAIYIDLADENIHKRLKKDDVAYYGSKHCIIEYFTNKVEKENKQYEDKKI